MELLDLDAYQLYQQLLFGETQASSSNDDQEEGAAFFQSPHPPMLSGGIDHRAVINPVEHVADDGSAMPLQQPGDGIWAGNGGEFMPGGGIWAGDGGLGAGGAWAAEEDPLMLGGDMFLGNDQSVHGGDMFLRNDQPMHGGSFPDLDGGMEESLNGVGLSEFFDSKAAVDSMWMTAFMKSLRTNQAAVDPSGVMVYSRPTPPADEVNQPASNSSGLTQVSADSPGLTSQMGDYPPAMDYPQPPAASVPQAVPDNETREVAQMARVAVGCGDNVSTAWSEEENQLLLEGLSRFADQDNVTKCFNIASGLDKKTVLDVAYRIRWLSDLEQKKKAAEQAELRRAKFAGGNVTKGKVTKGANKKSKYPLSEEALDSKSAKDIKRDNDRLMDRIEELLTAGQWKDSPDYFYYVKMNMDALYRKVSDLATAMEGLSVDEEEWEDVLKDRISSFHQAGKNTTTRP